MISKCLNNSCSIVSRLQCNPKTCLGPMLWPLGQLWGWRPCWAQSCTVVAGMLCLLATTIQSVGTHVGQCGQLPKPPPLCRASHRVATTTTHATSCLLPVQMATRPHLSLCEGMHIRTDMVICPCCCVWPFGTQGSSNF